VAAGYAEIIFLFTERRALTILTFRTLEPNSTQAAVSFVRKTGLTGCFAFAGVAKARVLLIRKRKQKKENATFMVYLMKIVTDFLG